MKKFILKVKKATKDFFTNKSAFSLVELIVVIAIMAVMAAVLAPALLGYVEKSRAQKDDSATSEIVQSVQLALADFDVYDELLEHSVYDNAACYIDTDNESAHAANKVILKSAYGTHQEQYMFSDDARLLDEVDYWVAGNMRGLTITFSPDKRSKGDTYNLKDGIINKFVGRKTGYLHENPELYNRIRSVIGDTLETTSQTYRNSDYTLFIQLGTTGGAEAVAQDAIKVWGQFSGTNLHQNPNSFKFASGRIVGEDGKNDSAKNNFNNQYSDKIEFNEDNYRNPTNIIPFGGVFKDSTGDVFEAGDPFPPIGSTDVFEYGDYIYTSYGDYWAVVVKDKTKESYEDMLSTIGGEPVTALWNTFANCTNLKVAPKLSERARALGGTFTNCTSLVTPPSIPSAVTSMGHTFDTCTALTTPANIPEGVTNIEYLYYNCRSLQSTSAIPSTVTNMYRTFQGCTSLTIAPKLDHITGDLYLNAAFQGCSALTNAPKLPENTTNATSTFIYCQKLTNDILLPCHLKSLNITYGQCSADIQYYHTSTCDGSCGVN